MDAQNWPQKDAKCIGAQNHVGNTSRASQGLPEAPANAPAVAASVQVAGLPDIPAQDATSEAISKALSAWLAGLKSRSAATGAKYEREARQFFAFLESTRGPLCNSLLHCTPADCKAFVALDPTLAPATRAIKAVVLRSLFGALVLEGLRATNPAAEVKVKRPTSGRHHTAVPKSAVLSVLAKLRESDKPIHVRDRALIALTLAVGGRRSEIAGLRVKDIEREDGKAYVNILGKGGKVARMVLRAATLGALDRWLEVGGHGDAPDAPLFHNMSHRPDHREKGSLTPQGIRAVVKRYFPDYTPHGLRARAITDVWQNSDGNLHYAQLFARHSAPTVTETVYIQAEKMAKAMTFAPDYA